MTDLDKMARELLAAEYDADSPDSITAERLRIGLPVMWWGDDLALRAIRAALLTAPPGYVLVPVELTPTAVFAARAAYRLDCSPQEAMRDAVMAYVAAAKEVGNG